MIRVVVAALHTFLAVAMASGVVLWLAQARLAATWERGFYGEVSTITGGLLVACSVLLAVSAFQLVSSVGHATGHRWGTWGLLSLSGLLALCMPPPMSWIVAGAAGALLYDLFTTRERPADEDEDYDDADFD